MSICYTMFHNYGYVILICTASKLVLDRMLYFRIRPHWCAKSLLKKGRDIRIQQLYKNGWIHRVVPHTVETRTLLSFQRRTTYSFPISSMGRWKFKKLCHPTIHVLPKTPFLCQSICESFKDYSNPSLTNCLLLFCNIVCWLIYHNAERLVYR